MDTPFGTATGHGPPSAHFPGTRTDGTSGMGRSGNAHLPLQFFGAAIRALRYLTAAHQKFEILTALGTSVFVERHNFTLPWRQSTP